MTNRTKAAFLGVITLTLALMFCGGCAGIQVETPSQDQFNGENVKHAVELTLGIKLPAAAWKKLSGEQVFELAKLMADSGVGSLVGAGSLEFHFNFNQNITTESDNSGELRARLRAMVAKELGVTETDSENNTEVPDDDGDDG